MGTGEVRGGRRRQDVQAGAEKMWRSLAVGFGIVGKGGDLGMQDEQTTCPTLAAVCAPGDEDGTDREHGVLVEVDHGGGSMGPVDLATRPARRYYEF